MNKSNLRLVSWVLVIASTTITFFLVYKDWLVPYQGYLYVIDGTGAIELAIIELSNKLRQPTILIEGSQQLDKIGFSLKVKDKNIEATVLCDDLPIQWTDSQGKLLGFKKELQVGEDPSLFFPFWVELRQIRICRRKKEGAVYLSSHV